MRIGYARISTNVQNIDLQMDALNAAGCEQIFTDTISGVKAERPGLTEAFRFLRENDTLVVWKLDRLGRSLPDLIKIMKDIENRKACFLSLQENIDTTSTMGKLLFHIIGSLADFERSIIVERTHAGLAAARARGRIGGRKNLLSPYQKKRLQELHAENKMSIKELCGFFKVSVGSLYNYIHNRS